MKRRKISKLLFSVGLMAAFGVSQLPSAGLCQMAWGMAFANGCRMPCCKTALPKPENCPLLKTVTPKDLIAPSPALAKAPLVLHAVAGRIAAQPLWLVSFIRGMAQACRSLIALSPAKSRSPPTDAHLLSA